MKPWTFSDADRAARACGWVLHHVKGSHHYYRKSGERMVLCIPRHGGNLTPGTQRSIMRVLGITPPQL
jgi:predicted RNA binding protein YcfA (HicA-like mRNA interferase family)